MKKILSFTAGAACMLTLAACSSASTSLEIDGTIYDDGVQVVTLNLSGSDDARFNSDISSADITLSGILEDKEIIEVYYVDETTVLLGLAGAAEESDDDSGKITVDASGMSNDQEVSASVQVDFAPYITVVSSSCTNINGVVNVSSQYMLPFGYFDEDALNDDTIQLVSGNGELSYAITDDGYLSISVTNYSDDTGDDENSYPEVVISDKASTFNTEITFYVGSDAPIYLEYKGNAQKDAQELTSDDGTRRKYTLPSKTEQP
jgi:hypothetical protein